MSKSDFWSRRKAAVAEEEAETLELPQAPVDEPGDEDLSDEELLVKYELPDPDTLKEGDDFTAFMSSAVPERLRNRALRKLWLTNPTLANVDGLVEYGEDYTDAATVVENLQTVYKIGKGMVQQILEDDEEDADDPELELAEDEPDFEPEIDDSVETQEQDVASLDLAQAEPVIPADVRPSLQPRPRMRFSFPVDA